ncbi:MAG: aminodeoxychorismate/anthranilate synthase component II [Flavobacteriales bacterium]|nr:aminodeoxychorismate/anthranilate synthase component II [Flavobacteriales bacterium]
MQRILLLDNFDSFTYNLEHYLTGLGMSVDVKRNNESISTIDTYDKIVLSPGPGLPSDAGHMKEFLERVDSKIPVLGVCLGMQAIAELCGGTLYNQEEVKHGVSEKIRCESSVLFQDLPSEISVGLYHSWAIEEKGEFTVTARSESGVIMAIENISRKLYGVQFHPESVMTPNGKDILHNFLKLT